MPLLWLRPVDLGRTLLAHQLIGDSANAMLSPAPSLQKGGGVITAASLALEAVGDMGGGGGSLGSSGPATPRIRGGHVNPSRGLRKGVSMLNRAENMALTRRAGAATDEAPASTPGGWQYICPVYSHTFGFGAPKNHSLQSDVDDCLFTVGLPPGRRSSEHWVARNVALIVCANPAVILPT